MCIEPVLDRILQADEKGADILSFVFSLIEDIILNIVSWCTVGFLLKKNSYEEYEQIFDK
jgi:hypothetical protein